MPDSAERKIQVIAHVLRERFDKEGRLVIDENMGDVHETYASLLHYITDGREGKSWGVVRPGEVADAEG